MLILTSLCGVLLLWPAAPVAAHATRGQAAQHQGEVGDSSAEDPSKAGRRISHASEGGDSVNDRSGGVTQATGQRTEYPKALLSNEQRPEYPKALLSNEQRTEFQKDSEVGLQNGSSRSSTTRRVESNKAVSEDDEKRHHGRVKRSRINKVIINIKNRDSSAKTLTSHTPSRNIAGTTLAKFLTPPGHSRTGKSFQHFSWTSVEDTRVVPESKPLPVSRYGAPSPTPLALPSVGDTRPDPESNPRPVSRYGAPSPTLMDLPSGGDTRPDPDSSSIAMSRQGLHSPMPLDLPQTSFSCQGRDHGYYADTEADCQVFHVCGLEGAQHSFQCPNGTIFNQQVLVCDWLYKFDCADAPQLYNKGNQEPGENLNNDNTLSTNSNTVSTNSNTLSTNSNTLSTNSHSVSTNSKSLSTNSNTLSANSNTLSANSNTLSTNSNIGVTKDKAPATASDSRSPRRFQGGKEGLQGNKISSNFNKDTSFQSINTGIANEKNRNSHFKSGQEITPGDTGILFASELDGIVGDGTDNDGEIFFISDDFDKDNSLVVDTLNKKERTGYSFRPFHQNNNYVSPAQRSRQISLFKDQGTTGFVPSYAFPLMAQNENLYRF